MHNFSDICGHEAIILSLQKSLGLGNHSHAYIFDGIEGVGKGLLAGVFAKALQCEENYKPCNECISCKAFGASNHPDIIYVAPKGTSSLGVDDIREQINQAAHIRPYKYKYKIFILDNADKMTPQAQNALLKTLEEPPSYAVFLLVSENFHNFLPTIISRCVILRLKPINIKKVEAYLADLGYGFSDAHPAAVVSSGSIGAALMLVNDENFKEDRKEIGDILNSLPDSNLWDILLLAKKLEKFKDNSVRMLNFMHSWYRDALVHKATGETDYFIQTDLSDNIKLFSDQMSFKKLVCGVDSILGAGYSLKSNGNYLLTMEVMLMKMAGF
ncbi:MAG: AAA family ATPase [Defluviitaleaceae bacterium]|nr:AAA family ATPase [Defluviitaleaceae bacterium]